jgi:hypothetical protein
VIIEYRENVIKSGAGIFESWKLFKTGEKLHEVVKDGKFFEDFFLGKKYLSFKGTFI